MPFPSTAFLTSKVARIDAMTIHSDDSIRCEPGHRLQRSVSTRDSSKQCESSRTSYQTQRPRCGGRACTRSPGPPSACSARDGTRPGRERAPGCESCSCMDRGEVSEYLWQPALCSIWTIIAGEGRELPDVPEDESASRDVHAVVDVVIHKTVWKPCEIASNMEGAHRRVSEYKGVAGWAKPSGTGVPQRSTSLMTASM